MISGSGKVERVKPATDTGRSGERNGKQAEQNLKKSIYRTEGIIVLDIPGAGDEEFVQTLRDAVFETLMLIFGRRKLSLGVSEPDARHTLAYAGRTCKLICVRLRRLPSRPRITWPAIPFLWKNPFSNGIDQA